MIGAWVVIAVGLILIANSAGRPESDNVDLPGTGSQDATNLLDKKLPQQANGSNPIVLQSSTSLAQGTNAQTVNAVVSSLTKNKNVSQAISPLSPQGASNFT